MPRMALLLLGLFWCVPFKAWGEPSPPVLNIQVDETGTAHIAAVLELSGKPSVARAVLMDYRRWPALFPHGLRIAAGREEKGVVTADLYVSRYFLPGEWHLITETRETEPGRLETRLIDGDFLRYHRVWRLTPVNQGHASADTVHAGRSLLDPTQTPDLLPPRTALPEPAEQTHAELEMEVQPKAWIPRWIFMILLKRELAEHFVKLQDEIAVATR